jgi:hypothetical protein
MKHYFYIFILLTFFLTTCTKNDKPLNATFVVDSLVYKSFYNVTYYYHISVDGGIPPYKINWLKPNSNVGFGPHQITLSDSFGFSSQINDKKSKFDLKYTYDYRDKIIGTYKTRKQEQIVDINNDTTNIDSIEMISITKTNNFKLAVFSYPFKPDSKGYTIFQWENPAIMMLNEILGEINLFPNNDSLSINYYYRYGGGYTYPVIIKLKYNGKKNN